MRLRNIYQPNLRPEWKPIPRSDAGAYGWREMKSAGEPLRRLSGVRVDHGVLNIDAVPVSANYIIHRDKPGAEDIYYAWMRLAVAQINCLHAWHLQGDFRTRITINREKTTADLDNLVKPLLDALQAADRIAGDHRMVELRAQWGTNVRGARIELWSATLQISGASHG